MLSNGGHTNESYGWALSVHKDGPLTTLVFDVATLSAAASVEVENWVGQDVSIFKVLWMIL